MIKEMSYSYLKNDKVGYVFDIVMTDHKNPQYHPECPERITKIFQHLVEIDLLPKLKPISSREATQEELLKIHTKEYLNKFNDYVEKTANGKKASVNTFSEGDIHVSSGTKKAALTAAGSTLNLLDKILEKKVESGFAIVRPPGHHATSDQAMGFCFFNNVALAAEKALSKGKKIIILDWDIHHGNGTEEIVKRLKNQNLMFISLHRADHGFYPGTGQTSSEKDQVYNYSLPPGEKGTDQNYLELVRNHVFPKMDHFNPDLIIVSAGFDAARGDPLGGYLLTSGFYFTITQWLRLITPNILMVLEGGYNLDQIPICVEKCIVGLAGANLARRETPK